MALRVILGGQESDLPYQETSSLEIDSSSGFKPFCGTKTLVNSKDSPSSETQKSTESLQNKTTVGENRKNVPQAERIMGERILSHIAEYIEDEIPFLSWPENLQDYLVRAVFPPLVSFRFRHIMNGTVELSPCRYDVSGQERQRASVLLSRLCKDPRRNPVSIHLLNRGKELRNSLPPTGNISHETLTELRNRETIAEVLREKLPPIIKKWNLIL